MRKKLTKKGWDKTHDRAPGCPRGGFFQPFFAPPPPSQCGILVPRQGQAAAAARSVCRKWDFHASSSARPWLSIQPFISGVCVHGVVLKLEATRVTWCQLSHSSLILIPVSRAQREWNTSCVNHIFCLGDRDSAKSWRATFLTMHNEKPTIKKLWPSEKVHRWHKQLEFSPLKF